MYLLDKKVISEKEGLITFEDGTTIKFPKENINEVLTNEPQEYKDYIFKIESKIVQAVFKIAEDYNLTLQEINNSLDLVSKSVNEDLEKINEYLYGEHKVMFAKYNDIRTHLKKLMGKV